MACTSSADENKEESEVEFGMTLYTGLGDRRPELSFVLSVWRE